MGESLEDGGRRNVAANGATGRVCPLRQRSPFLAPGTGFVEDNFSMDGAGSGSAVM